MATNEPRAVIGLVGLAVMGQNLVRNIARHGFPIAVWNRTTATMQDFVATCEKDGVVVGCETLEDFVAMLRRPRRVILLVKAGAPVDATLASLTPLLEPGDIVMDGGNSFFRDTERRERELAATGIRYLGVGVSGGEFGALWGPSLMPGGASDAYAEVADVLTAIAARAGDEPCCTHLGPGGAGHFVKMVHNGIEYGDMQLIAEAYALLGDVLGMAPAAMADVFDRWNEGPLNSYLIEITAKILRAVDPDTGRPMVDVILDAAAQKGTGAWTAQCAQDLKVPVPTIEAALVGRTLSARRGERLAAAPVLRRRRSGTAAAPVPTVDEVHGALYASKICSYAQGMALLGQASADYGWNLPLGDVARIWREGCIIRATFLDQVSGAFVRRADLPNLLVDEFFSGEVLAAEASWRAAVTAAVAHAVPVPAFAGSLAYFDAYRRERLPANLIQAQRDFFGAHTYQRVDREGSFHVEWDALT